MVLILRADVSVRRPCRVARCPPMTPHTPVHTTNSFTTPIGGVTSEGRLTTCRTVWIEDMRIQVFHYSHLDTAQRLACWCTAPAHAPRAWSPPPSCCAALHWQPSTRQPPFRYRHSRLRQFFCASSRCVRASSAPSRDFLLRRQSASLFIACVGITPLSPTPLCRSGRRAKSFHMAKAVSDKIFAGREQHAGCWAERKSRGQFFASVRLTSDPRPCPPVLRRARACVHMPFTRALLDRRVGGNRFRRRKLPGAIHCREVWYDFLSPLCSSCSLPLKGHLCSTRAWDMPAALCLTAHHLCFGHAAKSGSQVICPNPGVCELETRPLRVMGGE